MSEIPAPDMPAAIKIMAKSPNNPISPRQPHRRGCCLENRPTASRSATATQVKNSKAIGRHWVSPSLARSKGAKADLAHGFGKAALGTFFL